MAARVLAALALLYTACAQSEWQVGRGTFYGTDGWSIHQGSCGFYYISRCVEAVELMEFVVHKAGTVRICVLQDEPLGWNVAAMTHVNPLYPGSCG